MKKQSIEDLMLELEGTNWATVTQPKADEILERINNLSTYVINNLSTYMIKNLRPDVIKNLSPGAINNLSTYVIKNLSPYVIKNLSPGVIKNLTLLKKLKPLEKIYTKIFEKISASSTALNMETWHTCNTTHCIGGWTTFLHPDGKTLEGVWGTHTAASIILSASRPDAPLPNFFASNKAAMAFVKARAAEEVAAKQLNKGNYILNDTK